MREFRYFLSVFFLSVLLSLVASQARAQQQITLGQSIVALTGPWKFQIGDSPRVAGSNAPFQFEWSQPGFDDSGWETVNVAPKSGSLDPIYGISGYVSGWTKRGHPGYWGWAWYRIRVRVAARSGERLAINGPPNPDDAYQVFVNGRLLGSFGRFPTAGNPSATYFSRPRMFPLPPNVCGSSSGNCVIALRFWMSPATIVYVPDAGGMHNPPVLGQFGVVAARYQLDWLEIIRGHLSALVLAGLFFLLTVLAASLYFLDRSDSIYLWMAATLFLAAISLIAYCFAHWTEAVSIARWNVIDGCFITPGILALWAVVWWIWFGLRRPRWIPALIVGLAFFLAAIHRLLFVDPSPSVHVISTIAQLAFVVLMFWIVSQGIRRQGWEGWLVLPAVVLLSISPFGNELAVLNIRVFWFPFGVIVSLSTISFALLAIVIFVLLLRRLTLSIRRQKEQALDVKQAQQVQQVLIPQQLPQIPGLSIESEYRPAKEVGGDFFQIIPHPSDGSVLIVAGDVTGKGLQAGMLVALIVGAIQTAVDSSFDPLRALQSLNKRLHGRGHSYATCLALRIAADGSAMLANAGHLPPYLNNKELEMEGALPLGMIDIAEFSVMHFQLAPGDTLLLLSDGVAEAQDEHGHLFGFERIHALLQKPITVAEIATAAQAFGQQDDITVLRIVRGPDAAVKTTADSIFATVSPRQILNDAESL